MGIFCSSLSPTDVEPLPKYSRRNSTTLKCACCDGTFFNSSKHLCKGGCEGVHRLTNASISFDSLKKVWKVQGVEQTFDWSHDALRTANTSSQRRIMNMRGVQYSYSAFVHSECFSDEIRCDNNRNKITVCDLCSAWSNYKGGRAVPPGRKNIKVTPRMHCQIRQRLEHETTVAPQIWNVDVDVVESKSCSPLEENNNEYRKAETRWGGADAHVPENEVDMSSNGSDTINTTDGFSESKTSANTTTSATTNSATTNSAATTDATQQLYNQHRRNQLELHQSCTSALELKSIADRYTLNHPARATSYRIALGAYDMVVEQIENTKVVLKKYLFLLEGRTFDTDENSIENKRNEEEDYLIQLDEVFIVYSNGRDALRLKIENEKNSKTGNE